jgi:hypothetical protein
LSWFLSIDRLLRGGYTRPEDLEGGRVGLPASRLVGIGTLLGAAYGAFMGIFAGLRGEHATWLQVLASAGKVPLLFLLTLSVSVPSLYVFSALSDSRLAFRDTLRLLLAAIAVNLALLASFGPVTAFFTLSTESYAFMVLLNVLFFAVAGFVGLAFLRRALGSVFGPAPAPPAAPPPQHAPAAAAHTLPQQPYVPLPRSLSPAARSQRVFRVWTVIYGIVGAQMAWILRPFVGTPDLPFSLFRPRESNGFMAVLRALGELLTP